jgi:hypothetical protein
LRIFVLAHPVGPRRLAVLRQGTPGEQAARRELQTILDGFTEGFGTPQLVAARSLLSSDVRNPV